jgi:hypothetical protein
MHVPIKVKSPNNISKWQMEFNSAFKGLMSQIYKRCVNYTFTRGILLGHNVTINRKIIN